MPAEMHSLDDVHEELEGQFEAMEDDISWQVRLEMWLAPGSVSFSDLTGRSSEAVRGGFVKYF